MFSQIGEKQIMTQSIVPYDQTHLLVTHQDSISLLNMNTLEQKSVYEINNTFQISSLFYDNKGEVLWKTKEKSWLWRS